MQGNVLWFTLNTRSFVMCVLALIVTVGLFRYTTRHLIIQLPRWREKLGLRQDSTTMAAIQNITPRRLRLLFGMPTSEKGTTKALVPDGSGGPQRNTMSPMTVELQEVHVDASIC